MKKSWIKQGAEVQVVITPAGKEFITPITLSALTSKPVISEFFAQRDGTTLDFVSLDTTEKCTDVVTCFSEVEELTEHFDTCYNLSLIHI